MTVDTCDSCSEQFAGHTAQGGHAKFRIDALHMCTSPWRSIQWTTRTFTSKCMVKCHSMAVTIDELEVCDPPGEFSHLHTELGILSLFSVGVRATFAKMSHQVAQNFLSTEHTQTGRVFSLILLMAQACTNM